MSKEKSLRRSAERKALEALRDRSTRMGCAGNRTRIVSIASPRDKNGCDCKNDRPYKRRGPAKPQALLGEPHLPARRDHPYPNWNDAYASGLGGSEFAARPPLPYPENLIYAVAFSFARQCP